MALAMMTGLILAVARAIGEVAPLVLIGVVKLPAPFIYAAILCLVVSILLLNMTAVFIRNQFHERFKNWEQ